eukprot:4219757-Pyramimonas_sp.AAC.1
MLPPACVPPPSTALRGPRGSSSDGPSATARMLSPPPSAALLGLIGSFTEQEIHNCGTHNCIWLGPSSG